MYVTMHLFFTNFINLNNDNPAHCRKLRDLKRNRTMADKLIYIPNDDTQYCPFCRLQLVVET